MLQVLFKLLCLCWVLKQMNLCVGPLIRESRSPTAFLLSWSEALLIFTARHYWVGGSSTQCRCPRWVSPVWSLNLLPLRKDLDACDIPPLVGHSSRGLVLTGWHLCPPLSPNPFWYGFFFMSFSESFSVCSGRLDVFVGGVSSGSFFSLVLILPKSFCNIVILFLKYWEGQMTVKHLWQEQLYKQLKWQPETLYYCNWQWRLV